MDEGLPQRLDASQLGGVEPHAPLLRIPAADQLLFKIMTVENLSSSIESEYLHFNRVDKYGDFLRADPHDGKQLPADRHVNAGASFEKAPEFAAADYYDQSRARTYACCFSLENSEFIWREYANNSQRGKVCVVFNFGKLRQTLNRTLRPGHAALDYGGVRCHQFFALNYGMVDYVEWARHRANEARLINPILYTYMKDVKFSAEKELRISLSTIGMGTSS